MTDAAAAASTESAQSRTPWYVRVTRAWGRGQDHYLTRWLFLRLLGAVYLVAFLSYGAQVVGLIGHEGILPADALLERAGEQLGPERYLAFPSLYWLHPHDVTLRLLCWGGALWSLLLVGGILPPVSLGLAWVFYLSLAAVSQDFLAFQWDSLLLEVGFLAMFFAPLQVLPRLSKEPAPSLVVLWLLRWVLFRLMFGSGWVKLGDETWRNFTALAYHFETQPLPVRLAWYLHQAPPWFHEAAGVLVFFCELIVPLLIFGPRRLRLFAFYALAVFQILILATGNFAFFNYLTLALCVTLLDDRHLRGLLPKALVARFRCPTAAPVSRRWARVGAGILAVVVAALSVVQLVRLADRRYEPPGPAGAVVRVLQPLRLVNSYGLFAVMTTFRREIVIEGSRDGVEWLPYEFRWKPGDPDRAPRLAAPHQPRLDWQMWFAALGPYYNNPWFPGLMIRLLQGSPEVLDLFEDNPFPDEPPRYIRATLYDYRFTRSEEGAPPPWWTREELAPYFPRTALR